MFCGNQSARDNKEWYWNWEHLLPRVLGYKRKKNDIKEVDITEF